MFITQEEVVVRRITFPNWHAVQHTDRGLELNLILYFCFSINPNQNQTE